MPLLVFDIMAEEPVDCPADGPVEIKKVSSSTFHPTLWGDFFISYKLPTAAQEAPMRERAGTLWEEVRAIIKRTNDLPEMMDLIITLQRLGLDYNYEDEINKLLNVVYNTNYDGAKLNFNLLQLLYCKELDELTLWWKELKVESHLSFVRDRIVEIYFWMCGAWSEPQFSHSRLIATKVTALESILDDCLDSYATSAEGMAIIDAIARYT
ncbi:hypothetical protein PR202_ga08043 [Eleusine coracana subsp. coracana]|uniref:Sesquiterpene synthase n=1 Tax=Eleusine coracana subsp. coracana TaxID=191504 RepID=A0AAV5C160_ELECO|nr:hypothetical protein PR202_ga08043 [Eleusine coracana subsp. coracana]